MSAGSQYTERSTMPPRQVELPVLVLPQYMCRGDGPAMSGSWVFMCEYRHTVRKMPSPSALGVGRSPVFAMRTAPEPGEPFGIRSGSKATPGGWAGDAVMAGPSLSSGVVDGPGETLAVPAGGTTGAWCGAGRKSWKAVGPTAKTATTPAAVPNAQRRRRPPSRPADRPPPAGGP